MPGTGAETKHVLLVVNPRITSFPSVLTSLRQGQQRPGEAGLPGQNPSYAAHRGFGRRSQTLVEGQSATCLKACECARVRGTAWKGGRDHPSERPGHREGKWASVRARGVGGTVGKASWEGPVRTAPKYLNRPSVRNQTSDVPR